MPIIDPTVTLIVSIVFVMALVLRKVNVGVALGLGALVYGVLSLELRIGEALVEALNQQMLQTVIALTLSMFLADIYHSVGASSKLIEGLEVAGPRFAAFSTPAAIGLLPMPAGAYVSAVVVDPLYESMKLNKELKTFINYWFRHLWLTTWPLYQGVILASGLLGVPTSQITLQNMPITFAALISGLIFGLKELRGVSVNKHKPRRNLRYVAHLWPFLTVAFLTIVLGLNVVISVSLTVLAVLIVYRPDKERIFHALRYSINATFLAIIVFSFVFSKFIEKSGVAFQMAKLLSDYADVAVFAIPLIIVMGTGIEFTFIALAFPPLAPLLNSERLILSFAGGFVGAMLTPAHACLVMSADYYGSDLLRTYRLILPATLTTLSLILIYVLVI